MKIPERCQQCRTGVFIINFEHIPYPFLPVSIVDSEQVKLTARLVESISLPLESILL